MSLYMLKTLTLMLKDYANNQNSANALSLAKFGSSDIVIEELEALIGAPVKPNFERASEKDIFINSDYLQVDDKDCNFWHDRFLDKTECYRCPEAIAVNMPRFESKDGNRHWHTKCATPSNKKNGYYIHYLSIASTKIDNELESRLFSVISSFKKINQRKLRLAAGDIGHGPTFERHISSLENKGLISVQQNKSRGVKLYSLVKP